MERRVNKAGISLIVTLSAAMLLIPFLNSDIYSCFAEDTAAYLNWTRQFASAFSEGILYPRWMPESYGGFGSPTFVFYPPVVTWLTSMALKVTGDIVLSFNLVKLVGLALSGIFMYLFVRDIWGERAGLAAAVAYILLPYRVYDMYILGVHSSRFAFVWFPLTLYFVRKTVLDSHVGRPFAGLAVSYALLCSTHLLSGYMFSPVIFLFGLSCAGRGNYRAAASRVLSASAFGMLIAAAYLLPVLAESGFVHIGQLTHLPKFLYGSKFVFNLAGAPSAAPPPFNDAGAWAMLITVLIAAVYAVPATFSRHCRHDREAVCMFVVAGICIFLTTDISRTVWEYVPGMKFVIYPARWIAVLVFALATIVGASLCSRKDTGRRYSAGIMLLILAVPAALTLAADTYIIGKSCRIRHETLPYFQTEYDLNEYLPKDVSMEWFRSRNEDEYKALLSADPPSREGGLEVVCWASERRVFRTDLGRVTTVKVRTFNYPGWTATVDGKPAEISTEAVTGMILVQVPEGAHEVTLSFKDTFDRLLGKLISLFASVLALVLIFRRVGDGKSNAPLQ